MSARRPAEKVHSPIELLRQLDRWMTAAGSDAGHPWRQSIALTLAAHTDSSGAADAAHRDSTARLCHVIAQDAASMIELLGDLIGAGSEDANVLDAMRATVCRVGLLADTVSKVHGGPTWANARPEAWLFPSSFDARVAFAHLSSKGDELEALGEALGETAAT